MKEQSTEQISRRRSLYLLGAGTLALYLASCKKNGIVVPSQTIATGEASRTNLPPKTSTATASVTNRPPTSTAKQSPSATASREATASAIPEPTATRYPELLWNGDNPAPLGFLREIKSLYPDLYHDALVSGILEKTYQRKLVFIGNEEQIWMISVYFGDTEKGKKIVGEFFLGPDNDLISILDMAGRSLAWDPDPYSNTSGRAYTDEVKDLLKDLKIGKQYAFYMMTDADMNLDHWPADIRSNPRTELIKYVPYNTEIVAKMRGEEVDINETEIGWQSYIAIPPDH